MRNYPILKASICGVCLIAINSVTVYASPFSIPSAGTDDQRIVVARSTFLKPTYSDLRMRRADKKKRSDMAAMEIRKKSTSDNSKTTNQNLPSDPTGHQQKNK